MRNCMESPAKCARMDVERTYVAGRSRKSLRHFAAHNDEVLVDDARSRKRDRLNLVIARQILSEVDSSFLAKRKNGSAGLGIERIEVVHYARKNPALFSVRPVGRPACWLFRLDA